ncbi:uncharacterized protein LOC123917391 isoform X1 [Trifolium pratense]|uniref:uncharacterized protein LOC123917391 isoform X1 n=1 Tax=Trifolium pratense TaxID=57577 RepID=UPI001E695B44|nr:uncharacterized protein LOC123917391 isoform X1 [Trifolium pratense]
MRKKKVARSKVTASSVSAEEEDESVQIELPQNTENDGGEGEGFFACYLLTSLNPRFKGHTYIGFTVNPRRRIRQHNGEIGSGAWRTKKKRPWEMVLCIYGFPTNVAALQFEWAWQHPVESLAVRKAAVGFKSLSGVANKIKLAYTMLTLPSWQNMDMTVNFFSTKYMKHCAGCPNLPQHMTVEIGSMDELPCYTERIGGLLDNEDDITGEMEFDNNNASYTDRIDGLLENEDDITDEVEFDDNNANTSGSVPYASDDSITADSPKRENHLGGTKNLNHRDKISEPFGWNKEPEARESPGHSFTPQEQSEQFGSISSPEGKSLATSKRRVTVDTDFISSTKTSNAESSKPDSEEMGAGDVRGAFFAPYQAEIIDLSTPSPSCRNFIDRKKRRVSSSISSEFVDLTRSPNFIQLS